MRTARKLAAIELKLLVREPLTLIFALALPVVILVILGGVFGNEAEADVFRGVGAMSYYGPAYLALVVASVTVVSVPTHLAGSRERGVLRRLHASGVPVWAVVAAEMAVSVAIATGSAVVLLVTAALFYDFSAPDAPWVVGGAFAASALAFAAFGVLLGAVLPTARSAQGLGIMLWFVMLFLGGAGPPPEVLSSGMRAVGEATPLPYAVRAFQDGWLGLDAGLAWGVVAAMGVVSTASALAAFRWE
jgi:ABC-2 type transport system permease protein